VLVHFADAADRYKVSWLNWAYCGCNNPTYPFPVSTHTEDLVADPKQPLRGENVVIAKLNALARPYPLAIPGTPVDYGFDPSTRAFSLTYTTDPVDGRRRSFSGTCAEVFVPQVQYRSGYNINVTGARVVSTRSAGIAKLRALPGAHTVTVRVSPASRGRTDPPVYDDTCPRSP
jgi:endoglycosylceramidase